MLHVQTIKQIWYYHGTVCKYMYKYMMQHYFILFSLPNPEDNIALCFHVILYACWDVYILVKQKLLLDYVFSFHLYVICSECMALIHCR